MLLHGPVVRAESEPLEIASQLVAAVVDHAVASGVVTLFARPQSLDRIWVRFGFIPVPEGTLPPGLAGRPGSGLYAWRGGTALWTLREQPRD
jgi:N-acetylglutamate synthase-like GNAT family acetyltransferase